MLKLIQSVVAVGVLVFLMAGAMKGCVTMWDRDDCWRFIRQQSQGYPVKVPEWCYAEGHLER